MKPEDRRNQLLNVAQYLFFTKGFDDTTMADILAVAEISKGGFYHHFKSKDDLLFGVLDLLVKPLIDQINVAAQDTANSALDRLHRFLHLRSDCLKQHYFDGQVELFLVLNDDRNIFLHTKFTRMVKTMFVPLLAQVVQDGCDEGVFVTDNASSAAEMIFHVMNFFDAALLKAINARRTERADQAAQNLQAAKAMQYITIDRVLGLPDGTTHFGWPDVVELTMNSGTTKPKPPQSAG